jgi:hypothetical protein
MRSGGVLRDGEVDSVGAIGARERVRRWKRALFQSAFFRPIHPAAPLVVRRFRSLAREAFVWLVDADESDRARRLRSFAPFVASLRAAALAATRGKDASLEGVSRFEQFRAMRSLERFGLRPTDYHRFGLYRVPADERPFAVSYLEGTAVQKYLHRDVDRLAIDDKLRLGTRLRGAGLPTVPSIAVVEKTSRSEEVAAALVDGDVFVKRRDLGWGVGAMRFLRVRGTDAWRDRHGRLLDRDALARSLVAEAANGELLVQRRLENGGSIAPLTAGSLATLRIVTLRPKPGASASLLGAVLRMPSRTDAITDNFAGGGIAAPVLDASGTLGTGCTNVVGARRLRTHPLTGAAIEGHRIEEFGDAVRTALAAHELFPDVLSVGWDVAILAAGPIIVEGNIAWCPELMQQAEERMLLATPYGDACALLAPADDR